MSEKFSEFREIKSDAPDVLRIKAGGIKGSLNAFKFKDADTGQMICYLPAVEISGYGENDEKALEMAKFSIEEYFLHLMKLSPKKRESELLSLGWKTGKLKHKEFSKTFVDGEGELKNFNAAEGKVERLSLETA